MSLFDALIRSGALRTIDHALAQTLRRLDPATPDLILAGAALASLAIGQGHAAFDPARPHLLLPEIEAWPDADDWRAALSASAWVSEPLQANSADPSRPLVLEHGLLYLRRYREYEQRLALRLQALASASSAVPGATVDALTPLFSTLFPDARDGDRQARAAALALQHKLLLVTGGPGTGKTTTIARVLLLLLAQARLDGKPAPRIALAAPTGRAADRMAESLRHALAALRADGAVDATLCDALPGEARTLHRLLGTIPDSPRFRHDAQSPLPLDVVVVDEASMVDLPLMCKLVEAVPDGAHLILLGDRDQLPSVEAGDVLAAIDDAAGGDAPVSPRLARWLARWLGDAEVANAIDESAAASATNMLAGHRVQLLRGYRESAGLRLATLATAVRDGDAEAALALLRGGDLQGVHFHEDMLDPLAGAGREALLAPWRALQDCNEPAAALVLATQLRLLAALRDGPQGARGLNARIEELLAGSQHETYFHGRVLLVSENSYRHGLFNGDIGVCLRAPGGGTLAWFAGGAEGQRHFHPSALPAHAGAFAMTVHKAQGSEFDHVWLLLPRQDARTLSRELLYTAITRARCELHLCANEAVLRAALSRHALRVSGLHRRLTAHLG
jgi:exodeoxyribonuclease V alpha subunit